MENKKPLVLISNDDGYHANGIKTLVNFLKDWCDLLVVAPESARSGFACAFSATTPLRLKRRHNMGNDVEVWSCSGTPVDCVKLALDQFLADRKPNLIIGGINHGDNSSVNNHYSGTMGVAKEGCMQHIPSIAFSSCNYDENADLTPLRDGVLKVVKLVLEKGLPEYTCLNVNFPALPPFKGFKGCRMTHGSWINEVDHRTHPHGYDYYWMVGEYRNDQKAGKCQELNYWDMNTQFCGVCGAPMKMATDISKKCTECGKQVWPSLATAIIVLIKKDDQVLLVHARNFKGNFDSLVAGFVETGENLEEAVHREVMEETGLTIKNLKYFGSQPWPYPSGLMIGFSAEYVDGEIHLQKEELSRGKWFTKENLPILPEKLSIARKLIDAWLADKL